MNYLQHLGYCAIIVAAVVCADYRAQGRAEDHINTLGSYTKYVAEQVIKNVHQACTSPNV